MCREERTITGNGIFSREDSLRMAKMSSESIMHQLEYLDEVVNDLYRYCGMTGNEANEICTRFQEIGSILTFYMEDIVKLMKSDTDNSNTV
ncbi:MAG: hypothetical protein ACI4SI_08935 [Candidatus Ornithospirochaeta sp.]